MPMSRKPGIQGVINKKKEEERYKEYGKKITAEYNQKIKAQMEVFQINLQQFASQYKNDIKKNPEFRQQFNEMCSNLNVDPLVSSKGVWQSLLGLGDFYYSLGVQITEYCIATRKVNGGYIELAALKEAVEKRRGPLLDPISKDDIKQAINKLRVLGQGFDIVEIGKKKYIRSVPRELNTDVKKILELVQDQTQFCTNKQNILSQSGWNPERVDIALKELLYQGLMMIDDGAGDGVRLYWFPCLEDFQESDKSSIGTRASSTNTSISVH